MASAIQAAASAIQNADFLLFGAGAGMGVDSGLPDFRGDDGFWNAYPPLRELKISFIDMANPRWFERDPRLAWGFYGHRLNLYRATRPHAGFEILGSWSERKPSRVFTSNVDGQFQKAEFESIWEMHGSISHLQCTAPCSNEIWDAPSGEIEIDAASFRAIGALPQCPHCGSLARPNILMFGDRRWLSLRSEAQNGELSRWLNARDCSRLTVLEMGAGTAVASVRHFSEMLQEMGATLIRINPRESHGPSGTISLAMGAREALEAINAAL